MAKEGDGRGRISDPAHGIACRRTCARDLASSTEVKLRASALQGSYFAGWSGACSGSAPLCALTVSETTLVRATFRNGVAPPVPGTPVFLIVHRVGSGRLRFVPNRILCQTGDCSGEYPAGSTVRVTARPAPGSALAYWRGACRGRTRTCLIRMTGFRVLGAVFRRVYPLAVTRNGAGRVRSEPTKIDCGRRCAARFFGTGTATLTATPAAGSAFTGWSGDCVGAARTCVVATDAQRATKASFGAGASTPASLRVTVSGGGHVVSLPGGIDCGATCSASWRAGTRVELTTLGGPGSAFGGWRGACTGRRVCKLTISATPRETTAVFRKTYPVTVQTPAGTWPIRIGPHRVACTRLCSATFPSGTRVTLRTNANWTKPCLPSNDRCSFRVDGPITAVLTNETDQGLAPTVSVRFGLNVTTSGSGVVESSPRGIKCSMRHRPCGYAFERHERVRLRETPAREWEFGGWGGACSHTGRARVCKVRLPIPGGVAATFRRR